MGDNENLSVKTELAKKRIDQALAEYAANWENLKGCVEKEDLSGFLTVWKEEFDTQAKTARDKFFQLVNLLSNLEIQLDMLRAGKNWKKPDENTGSGMEWPPALTAVKNIVDAIQP